MTEKCWQPLKDPFTPLFTCTKTCSSHILIYMHKHTQQWLTNLKCHDRKVLAAPERSSHALPYISHGCSYAPSTTCQPTCPPVQYQTTFVYAVMRTHWKVLMETMCTAPQMLLPWSQAVCMCIYVYVHMYHELFCGYVKGHPHKTCRSAYMQIAEHITCILRVTQHACVCVCVCVW